MGKLKILGDVVEGGLNLMRGASKAEEAAKELTAAERAAAGRKAAELIKSQPQVKASEALGQLREKGVKRTTTTQADRTRVGGGNIGGAPFSAISEADPNYAGKVWGVMDEGTAARLKNLTDPETAWTTMLGLANQLKTNPVVFDKLKRGFLDSMKQGNLSPELEAKINHNLALTFGEGASIRDPKIWKEADTFEKRAALADLMMGQGIPPSKGGVALGGEKSGKGVIFRPTDILKKETEPTLLHTEHGGDVPTFAAGPRLFQLEKESEFRPDLHPGFPTLIKGKDLGYNVIPTPTEIYLPDWHKAFKEKKPERFQGPWSPEIVQRRKSGSYQLKGAEGPGYYDLALGLEGEGLPSQELTDEYIRHLIREGFKKGGAVEDFDSKVDKLIEKHHFDSHIDSKIEQHFAKGGMPKLERTTLRMGKGGLLGKGAKALAGAMKGEDLTSQAIGKAAESAGMKAPVTANKPLTTVQDFHTSFGDSVRKRAADMQATMDSFDYKYDKGQRVFTEDSARKNWPPMTVLGRVLEGNRIMREDPSDFLSKKIIDEATGKAKRTPHEPGYKVRLEHSPDNWSEFVIPESAIKGDVEMAGGGSVLKHTTLRNRGATQAQPNRFADGGVTLARTSLRGMKEGGKSEATVQATPRKKGYGTASDVLKGVHEFVSKPFGYDNPPAEMLSDFIGIPAASRVLDKLSYGEPITNYGKANVPFMQDDTFDAFTAGLGGLGSMSKLAKPLAKGLKMLPKNLPVGMSIKPVGDIPTGAPKLKVRPPSDNVANVRDANFKYPKTIGNQTLKIDEVSGGVRSTDPHERKRVKELADQMSSPEGYISRIIVDHNNNVIEGQHRLEALRQLGVEDVPVYKIEDLADTLPVSKMEEAMRASGGIHPDHVNQLMKHALDDISEDGIEGARQMNYGKFQKYYDAALNAASPEVAKAKGGFILKHHTLRNRRANQRVR